MFRNAREECQRELKRYNPPLPTSKQATFAKPSSEVADDVDTPPTEVAPGASVDAGAEADAQLEQPLEQTQHPPSDGKIDPNADKPEDRNAHPQKEIKQDANSGESFEFAKFVAKAEKNLTCLAKFPGSRGPRVVTFWSQRCEKTVADLKIALRGLASALEIDLPESSFKLPVVESIVKGECEAIDVPFFKKCRTQKQAMEDLMAAFGDVSQAWLCKARIVVIATSTPLHASKSGGLLKKKRERSDERERVQQSSYGG